MHAQGTAVYVPEKEALVWKIKSFPGGREFLLRAKFSLPSVAAEEEPHGRMPPIAVNFEIPYFTVSGIQARPSDIPLMHLGLESRKIYSAISGIWVLFLRPSTSPSPVSRRSL